MKVTLLGEVTVAYENVLIPSSSILPLTCPWMPSGRVDRTLALDFTKVSDVWTEMDASALRKLAPVGV